LLCIHLSGCLGLSLAGEAIRAGRKDINVVYAPGVTPQSLPRVQSFGVSVNGVDASGVTISAGQGATNTNVYSDMIAQELFRRGYYASSLAEPVSESSDLATFQQLRERGIDAVLVGSMNLSATTSVFGSITGGNIANTGVTAFTVKALDAATGRVLFIMSAQYGTSKEAGRVMTDFGEVLNGAIRGTVEGAQVTNVAGPAGPPAAAGPQAPQPPPASSVPPPPPIKEAPPPPLPLLDLLTVQQELNQLGYDCGRPDGVMGRRTRSCVRAFQQAEGLNVTGEVDQPTSDSIRRLTE
jgi:hypothetical protein